MMACRTTFRSFGCDALKVLAASAVLIIVSSDLSAQESFTKSRNSGSYFFRMTAKYTHGDEPIDFDIVVGCAVTVSSYRDGGSSFDAFRDPLFYVKPTRDGHAVALITPLACAGETTANGRVPEDFLPGVIWYETAGDFKLGIAYVSEYAYENPNSKLKFHGATIQSATREEWEAFRPIAEQNLYPQDDLSLAYPIVDSRPESLDAAVWDRDKLNKLFRIPGCYGVLAYPVSGEAGRAILRKYWPESRPRYWVPEKSQRENLRSELQALNDRRGPMIGDHTLKDYFSPSSYRYRGFATKSRGGMIDGRGRLPADIYPLRMDHGIPWLSPQLADAEMVYRDIDVADGDNNGFLYCYNTFTSKMMREKYLPGYEDRQFRLRIGGTVVFGPNLPPYTLPSQLFQEDKVIYMPSGIGLW